jgi:hypothetical protein
VSPRPPPPQHDNRPLSGLGNPTRLFSTARRACQSFACSSAFTLLLIDLYEDPSAGGLALPGDWTPGDGTEKVYHVCNAI